MVANVIFALGCLPGLKVIVSEMVQPFDYVEYEEPVIFIPGFMIWITKVTKKPVSQALLIGDTLYVNHHMMLEIEKELGWHMSEDGVHSFTFQKQVGIG